MAAISDAVVIGIVLGLVFAAVSYYLYSRVGQLERKVGLLENIMLDLKVTTEQSILSATEPPEPAAPKLDSQPAPVEQSTEELQTYRDAIANAQESTEHVSEQDARNVFVDSSSRGRPQTSTPVQVERESSGLTVNYESMTYKELLQLCKQRGITGTRNQSKAQLIEFLRGKPSGTSQTDLSSWANGTVSFTDVSGQSNEFILGSALEPIAEGGPIHDSAPESSFVSE
jgi:hypothetical protein